MDEPAPSARAGALPIVLTGDRQARQAVRLHVRVTDPAAAQRAGVSGVLFAITGGSAHGLSSVAVDYGSFRNAASAGWASRAHLVRLPACALTTPAVRACRVQTALPSTNDATATTVSAAVSRSPVVLAAVAGPAGSNGAFTASSLSPSGTWSVSTASGAFNWSYPITVPPAASGTVAPSVALSYSSAGVDGRVASTNNQPSWVGEGWDYSPGYIERTYRSCADDPAGTAPKTYDLCWAGQVVTMNLGGQSTPLVLDDDGHGWRAASDNGERVELLTGGGNGAHDGEHWRITKPDGTRYYFGLERPPGWTDQLVTNGTWTVPVYGAHTNEPCNNPDGFAASSCPQAWRWNLDYVEDPHGNAAVYYYQKEANYYGANKTTSGVLYTRGGWLDHIDYGLRKTGGSIYGSPAQDQVAFDTAERCVPTATFTCDPALFTAANAGKWPDTPQDQQCKQGVTCNNNAPTFWSTKRLTTITTQYRAGSAMKPVDSYALGQSFPTAGDPELFLNSITRTGHAADGTTAALPAVTFAGQLTANRVFGFNSQPEMLHWRLTSITSETGSVTAVTYSQPECTATNVPASPASNTKLCFPVFWTLPFQATPTLDYFHKYLATEVDVQEPNALSPTQVTKYAYLGDPAWHLDDNELVKPANRTFGQFRGYGQVEVRTGNPGNSLGGVPDARTLTRTTYFRGMSGATVTDSLGESVADNEAYANTPREVQSFNGDSSAEISTTITDPTTVATTASRARSGLSALVARVVGTARTRTVTVLAAGGIRTGAVTNRYDTDGRLVASTDSADGLADICTTRRYAENTTSWIRDRVAETITSQQACPPAGTAPTPVLTDTRTYYDGATSLGQVPGAGDPTRTENATDNTGGTIHYAVTTATYDAGGRAKSSTVYTSGTDTTGRTTTLAYTPADGGTLTQVVTTNAKNQTSTTTVDPGRGATVETIDVAGLKTDARYDPLGRLTATWLPSHEMATQDPSVTYAYLVRGNGPLAVTTKTLIDSGDSITPFHYATTVELYDALGQLRQTQSEAEGGGRVVADTFYDSHGWAVRSNNRWFTSGAPATTLISTADSAVNSRTITAYDGTGRPLLATDYNGLTATWSTRTVYGGDRVTVVPPGGGVTATTLVNSRGQTTEVRQYTAAPTITGSVVTGGTYQSTTYHYTVLGQQDGVTDPDNRSWTFGYDLADRKTSQTDPDTGTTTYSYDDTGDLAAVTDGRGQTLAYTYDVLGRRTAEFAGSTSGTKLASWTWDTLARGAGKLSFSTRFTPDGNYLSGVKGYDGSGHPIGLIVQIPAAETGLSGLYTTSFGYTSTGLPKRVEPAPGGGLSGELIGTTYTPLGNPKSTAGSIDYVNSTVYTPFGEPQQFTFGTATGAAQLTYNRDAQTRRVTNVNLSASTADPQLDSVAYTYDPVGNITRRADTMGGSSAPVQAECYRYDALARLSQAWTATGACTADPSTAAGHVTVGGPKPYWTSWTFDPAGLRTSQTQHALPGAGGGDTTTTYAYGTAGGGQPHTLTGRTTTGPAGTSSATYGYDAAGNTISRNLPSGSQTLSWDAENRLATVATPAGVSGYVYDADGNVLLRRDPGSSTLYLPGEELTRTASTGAVVGTRYYTHAGVTVGLRVGGANPVYLMSDQHGTTQVGVDAGNFAVTRRSFDPYGNPLGATTGGPWPDTHGFLNAPANAATGLSDLGARKYDPETGRFISADPALDPADSQALNGYTYADDNPVTNSDPSGLLCTNGADGGCWNPKTGHTTPTPGVTDKQGLGDIDVYHPKPPAVVAGERHVYEAKIHAAEKREQLLGIGREMVKIAADVLGVSTAIGCITEGGLSDCLQTAGAVLLSFAGGIAGKILAKYGAPWKWKAGLRLVDRLWGLVHKGIDFLRDFFKAKGEITDAERTLKTLDNEIPAANATVRDLTRIQKGNDGEPVKTGLASARTDQELLDSVFKPKDGLYMRTYPNGKTLADGNHRRFELLKRASDPSSTIELDTPIYIKSYGGS